MARPVPLEAVTTRRSHRILQVGDGPGAQACGCLSCFGMFLRRTWPLQGAGAAYEREIELRTANHSRADEEGRTKLSQAYEALGKAYFVADPVMWRTNRK